MTRKTYQDIANILRERKEHNLGKKLDAFTELLMVQRELADLMAKDNPRFDYGRFNKACEVADVAREEQKTEKLLERDCMECEETFEDDGTHDHCPKHRHLDR